MVDKHLTRTRNEIARATRGSKSYRAALKLFRAGDDKADCPKAFSMMSEAASLGETLAIEGLACLFDYGVGTRQDRREAFRLHKIAAEAGLPNAQLNLAMCYMDGAGTRKNRPRGVSLLRVLENAGTPLEAMHELEYALRYGCGVKRDLKSGFKWESAAADKGLPAAIYSVGVCLSRGEGVRQDKTSALKRFIEAGQKGHAEACFNVGYYYENGVSVARNLRTAKKWYQRSLKNGNEDAREALLRLEEANASTANAST